MTRTQQANAARENDMDKQTAVSAIATAMNNHAILEALNAQRPCSTGAYMDSGAILRWNSNNAVVPLHVFRGAGLPEPVNQAAALDADLKAFAAEYRRAQASRTPEQIAEQRAEARAAMGPGVDMVNVLTGERYTT